MILKFQENKDPFYKFLIRPVIGFRGRSIQIQWFRFDFDYEFPGNRTDTEFSKK